MATVTPHKRPAACHALSPAGRRRLCEFLAGQPLLAFDFDGTLAPIVPDPGLAALPASTASQLRELTALLPCVILSGRARADVMSRLAGLPFAAVIGNHGSEPFVDLEPLRSQVRSWRPIVEAALGHLQGVQLEDKGCSLSIHYRHAASRPQALAAAMATIRSLVVGRIIHGKCVLNLLPVGALDKGSGLRMVMRQLGRSHAAYLGDDDTDEDVFQLPASAGVLGIRVEFSPTSLAPLYVRDQLEVDELLGYLVSVLSKDKHHPKAQGNPESH